MSFDQLLEDFILFTGLTRVEIRIQHPESETTKTREAETIEQFINIVKMYCEHHNIWIGINERKPGGTTKQDVTILRNLVVDVDRKNKQGDATKQQLEDCRQVVNNIIAWSQKKGFNLPVIVFSGNGFHLWWNLPDIEVTDENRIALQKKIEIFFKTLNKEFSTETVEIDPQVSDLSRCMAVPGTLNQKCKPPRERKLDTQSILKRNPDQTLWEHIENLKIKITPKKAVEKAPEIRKHPPCIEICMEGVEEGKRHDSMLVMAWYYGFMDHMAEQAAQIILDVDKKNKPPNWDGDLDQLLKEVERIFETEAVGEKQITCEKIKLYDLCPLAEDETCKGGWERFKVESTGEVWLSDEETQQAEELLRDPEIFDKFLEEFGKKIKKDDTTKKLVFLTGLSAYTGDPLNLFLKGPPSIGKSHNSAQILSYFPQEDTLFLGDISPKALVHDHGEWDEERRCHILELNQKILVFLESPCNETFHVLLPILSHDKYEIAHKITDKTAKGKLKTKTVIIRGWPATIFCAYKEDYFLALNTRGFSHTPEMTSEKYLEANRLTAETLALPNFPELRQVQVTKYSNALRVLKKVLKKEKILIPLMMGLAERYEHTDPRDMRDFKHVGYLLKSLSALYVYQLPKLKATNSGDGVWEACVSARPEYETLQPALQEVIVPTRAGLSKYIIDFFKEVLLVLTAPSLEQEGISYQEVREKYFDVYKKRLGKGCLSNYLNNLEEAGWVWKEADPSDKRKKLIYTKNIEISSNLFNEAFSELLTEESAQSWIKKVVQDIGEKHTKKFDLVMEVVKNGDVKIITSIPDLLNYFYLPDQRKEAGELKERKLNELKWTKTSEEEKEPEPVIEEEKPTKQPQKPPEPEPTPTETEQKIIAYVTENQPVNEGDILERLVSSAGYKFLEIKTTVDRLAGRGLLVKDTEGRFSTK